MISLIIAYAAVGSAVPPFRQYFELSEGAYFSHPVFGLLIGLLCLSNVVATFRRIRFNLVNAGAIGVHTGMLLLAGGCFLYFGWKIEGDVLLTTPRIKVMSKSRVQRGDAGSAEIGSIVAATGKSWHANMPMAGGQYDAEVLSVKNDGMVIGSEVTLKVTSGSPRQTRTITLRQRDANVVDFNAQVLFTLWPANSIDQFYDNQLTVLNVRANGSEVSLPLHGLPQYGERLLSGGPDVLDANGRKVEGERNTSWPLLDHWRLPIPLRTGELEPSRDWPVRMEVDGFLPYADLRTSPMPGGTEFNPVAMVNVTVADQHEHFSLFGKLPRFSFDGAEGQATAEFRWLDDGKVPASWSEHLSGSHVLSVEVKDRGVKKQYDVHEGQEIAVEGTEYRLKVDRLMPTWPLMTPGFEGAKSPVAQVSVQGNGKKYQRTVIERYAELSQDIDEAGKRHRDGPYDPNLVLAYKDCTGHSFLIAAGKDLSPVVIHTSPGGAREMRAIQQGQTMSTTDGVALTLDSIIERPMLEARPVVIPSEHRQREAGRQMSLVRVKIESKTSDWTRRVWVPFTQYGYIGDKQVVPVEVPVLGSIELVYGRFARKLPGRIAAEQLVKNFNPGRSAVRDWHSFVRFEDPETHAVRSAEVYTNHTERFGNWTLFQSTADPKGEEWTGLGVGNRLGIMPMTLGCIFITAGMLYAFYTKPVLKRRLKEKYAMQAKQAAAKGARTVGGVPTAPMLLLVCGLCGLLGGPTVARGQPAAGDPHAGLDLSRVDSASNVQDQQATPPDPQRGAAAFDSLRKMAAQLDLSALRLLVVQHAGRYQTVEEWSRDIVKTIHGSADLEGFDPVVSAMEITLNHAAHEDDNLIRVKELGVRVAITSHPVAIGDAEMRRIRATGMVSLRYLTANAAVTDKLQEMESKVMMQRATNRVKDSVFFFAQARETLRVVPSPSGNYVAEWFTLDNLVPNLNAPNHAFSDGMPVPGVSSEQARKLVTAWLKLEDAWRNRDAATVNAHISLLTDELPRLAAAGVYMSASQRKVEAFYTRMSAFTWGWGIYILGLAIAIWAVVTGWRFARGMALTVFLVAFVLHGLGIGLRWYIVGRIPVANMFEAVVSSAWVGAALALGLELRLLRAWQVIYLIPMSFAVVLQQRYAGTSLHAWWVVLASVSAAGLLGDMIYMGARRRGAADLRVKPGIFVLTACFLGFSSLALGEYAVGSEITTIMGILDDVLLRIHTVLIITSYSIVTLAFGVAACYLVVRAWSYGSGEARATLGTLVGAGIALYLALGQKLGPDADASMVVPVFVLASLICGALAWVLPIMLRGRGALTGGPATALMSAAAAPPIKRTAIDSPLLAGLDLSQMTLMNMANIGLFVGMILGAVWADYSWGRPWGWDPKEVFALNTWLIYAILIHVRFLTRDKGLWSAVVACVGFAMMMFNWWAVNFYIVGLHSYA